MYNMKSLVCLSFLPENANMKWTWQILTLSALLRASLTSVLNNILSLNIGFKDIKQSLTMTIFYKKYQMII
jgi:hypothetical protein